MPINPDSLIAQIEKQAGAIRQYSEQQVANLPAAVAHYQALSRANWLSLEELSRGKQAGAMPVEELHHHRRLAVAPQDYIVVASDGSAIPPDRHGGMAHCQVINIGRVVLGYGAAARAEIDSDTRFYLLNADGDHDNNTSASQLLEVQGSVDELAVALQLATDYGATLALRDGPLTLWASSILNSPEGRTLTARYLELIKEFTGRHIPVIGYTSNSRSDAVITALREMSKKPYRGLLDADLFWKILTPGECSPAFRNSARHSKDTALTEEVYFMYLRTEDEVVRLEFSHDLLQMPEFDTALAIIGQQIELGQGYPVALMEAHESAVLRGADRELLRVLLEDYGFLTRESQKGISKRLRPI